MYANYYKQLSTVADQIREGAYKGQSIVEPTEDQNLVRRPQKQEEDRGPDITDTLVGYMMAMRSPVSEEAAMGAPTGNRGSASGSGAVSNPQAAEDLISRLVERGMPQHIAIGFVANFQAESGLDAGINERNPVVPGSRGGFGLYQLTGPRRREFEAYAKKNGRELNDADAQLDFMMGELSGSESSAWSAIQRATTAEEAARLVSEKFLRPGKPHLENRLAVARSLSQREPLVRRPA